MKTKLMAMALLAGGALLAQPRFGIGVTIGGPAYRTPAPVVVAYRPPCPGPEYVWIDGYWDGPTWIDGYWGLPPYAGAYWVGPRWVGGSFYRGYWGGPRYAAPRFRGPAVGFQGGFERGYAHGYARGHARGFHR
jgi:hypothetical protein